MTFKHLKKKILQLEPSSQQTRFFELLHGKPFWIWDIQQHKAEDFRTRGLCCFNHIIGLPKRNQIEKPLFDYEKIIHDTFQESKHIWIKKATGLGITEFMLRYIAWLCLKNDRLKGSQMCIVTGPRIDLAITLVDRLKKLFTEVDREKTKINSNIRFETSETVLELNGVRLEAFPSHHLDAMRGLTNVSFIFLDEADFFPPGEQQDARDVSERYIAKSDPYIVMVSTPNAPGGLFENIEKETEEKCLYKRIKLDYTYGINKIYSEEEIKKAMKSPSFEREYNLKYLGLIGNIFHEQDIANAICSYKSEDLKFFNSYRACMGVDCGFGSSSFGIVVTRLIDGKIQVVFADEYERPDYNIMLTKVYDLYKNYQVDNIYVDGANPEFIRSLKVEIGESSDAAYYNDYIEMARKNKLNVEDYMKVVPVYFAREHKAMLTHCKMIFEEGLIQIDPRFDKLIVSLRTALENGEGILDKQATSFNDVFDAFRMAMKFYVFKSL
jgi:hypothetical protein